MSSMKNISPTLNRKIEEQQQQQSTKLTKKQLDMKTHSIILDLNNLLVLDEATPSAPACLPLKTIGQHRHAPSHISSKPNRQDGNNFKSSVIDFSPRSIVMPTSRSPRKSPQPHIVPVKPFKQTRSKARSNEKSVPSFKQPTTLSISTLVTNSSLEVHDEPSITTMTRSLIQFDSNNQLAAQRSSQQTRPHYKQLFTGSNLKRGGDTKHSRVIAPNYTRFSNELLRLKHIKLENRSKETKQ